MMRRVAAGVVVLFLAVMFSGLTGAQEGPFQDEDIEAELDNGSEITMNCMVVQERQLAFCVFSTEELQQPDEEQEQDQIMEDIQGFIESYLEQNETGQNDNDNEVQDPIEQEDNTGNDDEIRPPWYDENRSES